MTNAIYELKSCPFCGGEASWIAARQMEDGTYYPAACGCRKCGIWRYGESNYGHGGFATEEDRERSMKQAIAKWNTRACEEIAATLGDERLAFLEEKVKLQGDYIYKLIKEKHELFAQNCEAATRHAAQMDRMKRELEAATLGGDEKLLDLAQHAWDIAVCAMQGMPIPASWGNAVEKGLRERGIDVDKLPYVVPDATLGGGECELVEVDSYRSDMEIIHVLECSACGKTCEHVNGSYPKCPHCGARAVKR